MLLGIGLLFIGSIAAIGAVVIGVDVCKIGDADSDEPLYDLTVSSRVEYNPTDVLGQKWYVSSLSKRISEHKATGICAWLSPKVMFWETGSISAEVTLIRGSHSIETQEATLGSFNKLSGGSTQSEFSFTGIPSGEYSIRWVVKEDGVERARELQSGIRVGGS